MSDQYALDAIATLLGTKPEWSGADDLESIAEIVSAVRPAVGDNDYRSYAARFTEATGRQSVDRYDYMINNTGGEDMTNHMIDSHNIERTLITRNNYADYLGQVVRIEDNGLHGVLLGREGDRLAVLRINLATEWYETIMWASLADDITVGRGDSVRYNIPAGVASAMLNENRVARAQTRIASNLQDKIDNIVERAHQEADERGWCDDFDKAMDELDLPTRKKEFTVSAKVTLHVDVDLVVTDRNVDAALRQVENDLPVDIVLEAVREQMNRMDVADIDALDGVQN